MQTERTCWINGSEGLCAASRSDVARPWRLVLLGAPGVGKGTQAELLSDRLGGCQLSTGEVFRAARSGRAQTPALEQALGPMQRGELVPDPLVVAIVAERSHCLLCERGFLLDGFPRTIPQAAELDRLLARLRIALDAVIDYRLATDTIVDRLGGRRICPACRAIYHAETRPPRVAGVCDACGGGLEQRADDRPEAVRVRMAAYERETAPLVDFYRRRGLLLTVDASGTPEQIVERTLTDSRFSRTPRAEASG